MAITAFAMVAAFCAIAVIVAAGDNGRSVVETLTEALYVAMIGWPVVLACGLIWLPALLLARHGSDEMRAAVVLLSPLSFVVLYAAVKLFLHATSKHTSLDLDILAIFAFAPIAVIYAAGFLAVDRRLDRVDTGMLAAVFALCGVGLPWAYHVALSTFMS